MKERVRKRDLLWKVLLSVLLGLVTTGALILSRGSTLLLVAQLKQRDLPVCGTPTCPREEVLFDNEDSRPAWLWSLLLVLTIPHIITFIRSLILMFTQWGDLWLPNWGLRQWIYALLEPFLAILHTLGLCLLFFVSFPELPSAMVSLITSAVAWFPGLLKIMNKKMKLIPGIFGMLLDGLAVLVQLVAVVYTSYSTWDSDKKPWSLPLGLVLTSLGWWTIWLPSSSSRGGNRQQKLHEVVNYVEDDSIECVKDALVAFGKVTTAFVFFFTFIESTDLVSNYNFDLSYTNTAKTSFRPGPPPAIWLNENLNSDNYLDMYCNVYPPELSTPTSTTDGQTSNTTKGPPFQRDNIHYFVAYPDSQDCAAYWIRECPLHLYSYMDSLNYTICPVNHYFPHNSPTTDCKESDCCTPMGDGDGWRENCGNRESYESCINQQDLEAKTPFPTEKSDFTKCGPPTEASETSTTSGSTTTSTGTSTTTMITTAPENSTAPAYDCINPIYDWYIPSGNIKSEYFPVALLFVQLISTFLAYSLCYLACSSTLDIIGFALPVHSSQILVTVSLALMCQSRGENICFGDSVFPAGLFFVCNGDSFLDLPYLILYLAFAAQLWIAGHIWTAKNEDLDKDIFFDPLYESLLIEQSMMFTRKTKDKDDVDSSKSVMKIFGCATMWHETKEELVLLGLHGATLLLHLYDCHLLLQLDQLWAELDFLAMLFCSSTLSAFSFALLSWKFSACREDILAALLCSCILAICELSWSFLAVLLSSCSLAVILCSCN